MNAARLRAVWATTAVVGQQEAQDRRTKAQRKENARKRKRERQQTQWDVWAQVATEPGRTTCQRWRTRIGLRRVHIWPHQATKTS